MKKINLLALALIPFLSMYAQSEKIDWNADLDYLAKELPEKHYNLFAVKSEAYFLSGINEIKQKTDNLTDFQVALKIQQLIAQMGDSHTRLNFSPLLNVTQILPLQLFWASDGLYVLHTTLENAEILGCKLLSINTIPIATVIDSLSTLFSIDNQAMVKAAVPPMIPSLQILEYFGFSNTEQVELGLETTVNQTYILKPSLINRNNRVSVKPDSLSFSVKNENQIFTDFYDPDQKIYHILYNKCLSKEVALEYGNAEMANNLPSFKTFEDQIFNTLNNKSVTKIIFDMRYNSGGNSAQGTSLIEKLAKFLDANPTLKTYVVLGRATFSSAILNALDFKRLTNAIFIGEETSGKLNHFGEIKSFQLPTSKLAITYSTNYFKMADEDANTLAPDVPIETSFSDLMRGIDPVYEWVKRQ